MPNIPQQETIVQYVANSAQTAYTFAFYAPEETDIEVYYQASNATPVPAADILDLSTDYTVTYNSDPITGGTITLLFTPTSGYYLTINRNVLASLNTNFAAAQTLSGQTLDTAFDRLLLLCQQNQNYALERNLSYIINTYLPNATPYTQLPTLAQNYIWIGSGSGVTAALISQVPSASVLQSLLADNSPGSNGAGIVGYYDKINVATTTVKAFLDNISSYVNYGIFAIDTGSVNALLAAPVPAFPTYHAGTIVRVLVAHTTTVNSPTLNVNGIGAGFVNLPNGLSLLPGDMIQGMIAELMYDTITGGWQLLNPAIGARKGSVAASAYCSTTHAWTGTGSVKILFDTAETDPLSLFDPTNNRFIANYAGTYRVSALLAANSAGDSGAQFGAMILFKNGAVLKTLSGQGSVSATSIFSGDAIVTAAANDYFEIYVIKTGSVDYTYASDGLGQTAQQCSQFSFEYLGT